MQSIPAWEKGLNPEQREGMLHGEGPCIVLAVAGSGKTEMMMRRIARLVSEGVDPEKILAVTFSKKGADEMNSRLMNRLATEGCRVGTWHSLCLQILREDETRWGAWEIDDRNRSKILMKEVLGYKQMNWKADLARMLSFVGLCKASLFEPADLGATELAREMFDRDGARAIETYSRHAAMLEDKGLLTFDDFLVFAVKHLSSNESARRDWAGRWNYLVQDEAQDANLAQWTLGDLLARDHRNFTVVGDLSQAIYTWRGGRPELLAGFAKKWDARTIVMHRNYRCGQAIIDAGNAVIRPAVMRVEADMTAERGVPGEVRISGVGTYDDEGEQIATEIATEIANGDATPSDYFVLYRVNAQSRAIEERLLRKKVPYVILGGTSFYDRREVKDLLAYLRVASGDGELDDVKRCVNSPFRFLGAKFVERLIAAAERVGVNRVDWSSVVRSVGQEQGLQSRQRASASDWAELIDQCGREIENGTRPARILDDVIRVTKYMEYVRAEDGEETVENSSEANVREMVRVAEQFATARELLNHIEQTHRDAARASRVKGERVVLMTVHRSKGLEAKHVYVVGLNEGTMPHGRGDPEEERRLAYVAFTRARDVLSLSYVRSFATKGGVKEAKPSRFLADAGLLATVESESIPLCK